ncbi:hypothetical protein EVAR_60358_1 [Eumeta japonica]|uniref:RNA-directed DNA polymerase from mobile element jockey n=1 Tax=Eumeta variegata TaxID=151549 RepID=A0A4C1Z935_EUMVA|nr:hypothetical protein EVAR_60358_1 [Eumeta japonica]
MSLQAFYQNTLLHKPDRSIPLHRLMVSTMLWVVYTILIVEPVSSSSLALSCFHHNQHRPDIFDIALVKRVALRLGGIETVQRLNSDHRPVLLKLCPLTGDKAKTAALHRVRGYSTTSKTCRARVLQRKMRTRIQKFRNDNWSTFMEKITSSHKAYWKLVKDLKPEGYEPHGFPSLKKPDNSVAFDDRDNGECLADSIERQCSHTSSHTTHNTFTRSRRKFDKKSPSIRRAIWFPFNWIKFNPTSKNSTPERHRAWTASLIKQ